MGLIKWTYCVFLLLFYASGLSATDVVRYVESEKFPDAKQSYFVDLLTLVLESSFDQYGDYQLMSVVAEMSQARTTLTLERNEMIDLTWRMSSKAIEQQLQAIYFPLLKGLMGHRIFIIRADEQVNFDKNISLKDLQKIVAGQGQHWPDTEILIANNFKVTSGYDDYLMTMLTKKRFDYFPRALHEPWLEIKDKPEFIIEKNLMLRYPAPMYFFVNKTNKRLHQRLTYGFEKIVKSGQFEKLFLNHPITSGILEKAKVRKRVIFDLENPLLSEKSKELFTKKHLWIEVSH
ncbi:MAG: hypothetical protein MJK12_04930 [Colwellia sp.]|nr:hypothetical protein [Colwellia sp.]